MPDAKQYTEPLLCSHCNNKLPLEILGEIIRTGHSDSEGLTDFEKVWQVLLCPTCHRETVRQRVWFSEWADVEIDDIGQIIGKTENFELTTLYPEHPIPKKKLSHLPRHIERAYEIALRVYSVDTSAFAVFVGKAMECLCNDNNAPKNMTIQDKINDLVKRNIIPPNYGEIAHLLRQFRNDNAHNCEIGELSREDAEAMLDLCEKILDYVYEAPLKKQALEKRRNELRKP